MHIKILQMKMDLYLLKIKETDPELYEFLTTDISRKPKRKPFHLTWGEFREEEPNG